MKIGKPLDFSRFDGMAGNRFIERAVIDEVMYELMQLSGQEYVDIYAASSRKTQTRQSLRALLSSPIACRRAPPVNSVFKHLACV